MTAVTAESQTQYLAYRRFIYRLSRQLSEDEAQAIVYIHFFDQKESLKSASTLDILCKMESSGIATASCPEKLLELVKDLKRNDLVSEVKDFLKKRKSRTAERKGSSLGRRQPRLVLVDDAEEVENEDDLILRNTLEAAIVQATVLLQHMEMIQSSISGSKIKRGEIRETVTQAAQTSEALAERLRRAEVRINQDDGQVSSGSHGEGNACILSGESGFSYINMAGSGEAAISCFPQLNVLFGCTPAPLLRGKGETGSREVDSKGYINTAHSGEAYLDYVKQG